MALRALLLTLVLSLGLATAQVSDPAEAIEDALELFQGGQIYCKFESFGDHPIRTLCFLEKGLVTYQSFDVSVASRLDLTPYFAYTPMVLLSYTEVHWFVQTQVGVTIYGDGGFYFGLIAGLPLP